MEIMSRWERRGYETGLTQGAERIVARMIGKRFGSDAPPDVSAQLDRLSVDQLDELGEALFDFTEPAELENWLAQRVPQ